LFNVVRAILGLFNVVRAILGLFNVVRAILGLFNLVRAILGFFNVVRAILGLFNVVRAILGLFNVVTRLLFVGFSGGNGIQEKRQREICIYFLVSLREPKTHVTRHIKLSMDGGYVHTYG